MASSTIPMNLTNIITEANYPADTAPSAFPVGLSLISTASGSTYPYSYGVVFTVKISTSRAAQFSVSASGQMKMRGVNSSAWSAWKDVVT